MVVPFAAGGSTDIIGRAVAIKMGELLGQPIVMENIGGASTMIGADRVAKSPSDGYTLLVATSTTFATNPHLYKKMTYKIEDFAPISLIAKSPLVLALGLSIPASTLKDFVAYAKARPGQLSYGTTGIGGNAHLTGAMVASALGIKMEAVPYKGSAPALTDVMGGSLPMHFDSAATSLPLYRAGKIRVLAITSERRVEAAPEIPTFTELGYDVSITTLIGLFAPAGTPTPIVQKLNATLKRVLSDPDLLARFRPDATIAEWTTPDNELEQFKAAYVQAGKVIQSMGIQFSGK